MEFGENSEEVTECWGRIRKFGLGWVGLLGWRIHITIKRQRKVKNILFVFKRRLI